MDPDEVADLLPIETTKKAAGISAGGL